MSPPPICIGWHQKNFFPFFFSIVEHNDFIIHIFSSNSAREVNFRIKSVAALRGPKQPLLKSAAHWHTRGITDFALAVSSWNYPAIPKWISTNLTVLPLLTWCTVYSVVSGDYLIAVKPVLFIVAFKIEQCVMWLNFPTSQAQMGGWNSMFFWKLCTWEHLMPNPVLLAAALIHSLSRFINTRIKMKFKSSLERRRDWNIRWKWMFSKNGSKT